MMKHLKVEVNGQEWVNGEFSEITFTDGPTGVKIEAKVSKTAGAAGNPSGRSLLEMFANATRAQTQSMVEEKRAELSDGDVVEAEPAETA